MANYTQQEADDIIDSGTNENIGKGWIDKTHYCPGCNELDEEGNPIVTHKGWRFALVNADGNPFEFLLEDMPEDEPEASKLTAAKERIKSIDKDSCEY